MLQEIAIVCRNYGVSGVWSDQYEQFGLASTASRPEIDIGVWVEHCPAPERLSRYEGVLTWMSDGEMDLPPDKQLRADLLAVRQKLTPNGFTVQIPETPDGRHADFAARC